MAELSARIVSLDSRLRDAERENMLNELRLRRFDTEVGASLTNSDNALKLSTNIDNELSTIHSETCQITRIRKGDIGQATLHIEGGVDWSKFAFGTEMTSATNLRVYAGYVEYWGLGLGVVTGGTFQNVDVTLTQNPAYVYAAVQPGFTGYTIYQSSTVPSMTDAASVNTLLCICESTAGVYAITYRFHIGNIKFKNPKV